MIIFFVIAQILVAAVLRLFFLLRHRPWSHRHTLFCTVVPFIIFLLWVAFWCWVPSSDLSPTPLWQELWLDRHPDVRAIIWACVLPIIFAWLLFIYVSDKHGRGDHAA
jgi:hypothetical protein